MVFQFTLQPSRRQFRSRGLGTLDNIIFFNGEGLGWEGIITVDNVSYEYLGNGFQAFPARANLSRALPTKVNYDSQWSNFTFIAGPVELTACFFSPVIPQDLCHGEYNLNWAIEPNCFDCNITGSPSNVTPAHALISWIAQIAPDEQVFAGESEKDFPLWGTFTYTSTSGTGHVFTWQSGYSVDLRDRYLTNNTLSRLADQTFRSSTDREPVFAFAHDMDLRYNGSVLYTVGSMQSPTAQYLGTNGLSKLEPWWMGCYGGMLQMVNFHYADFATASAKGSAFEAQLREDVDRYYQDNTAVLHFPDGNPPSANVTREPVNATDQFGQDYTFDPATAYGFLDANNSSGIAVPDISEADSYYAIVALSARQVMGAYILTAPPPPTCNESFSTHQSEPFMFQKEISSNGNMNTIDVMYPAMPFFLYTYPELIRFLAIHDLGTAFPNGTGHIAGDDEPMPVEECGNMLIMSYAYYKFSGNAHFLEAHFPIMQQWATYLIDYSLIPKSQLSIDDFAGTLTNQTNLAIKGIIGLKAISLISEVVGRTTAADIYENITTTYFQRWTEYAIDPSGTHTLLAYQLRSSWGLLYNTYPDKLLNLGLIPDEIYDMQSKFYPTVSQIYGVPLDSRHSYIKSDWEMWTAATCSPSTRRLFVNSLAYWLNNTSTNLPLTDLHETIGTGSWPSSPDVVQFLARPVVGGHFSLLALLKAGEDSASGTSDEGSLFGEGQTDPIVEEQALYSLSAVNGSVALSTEVPTVLDTSTGTWTTKSTMRAY
ncbi:hypothetical protein M409DRAFT_63152 [Zasmidium cellare ATCC 36951]|uniref:DUF1793-domain-containing protein n=1 Tax=Zasmidium cellare ATCC 36951 TaxID=1080233 RepID=A0A6A6D2Y8_ZASCE|nr:uncharacterized protein M409DRAFT_63152 [Zasmidium cellare ATCC 36951]KAF2172479.1 hypothetical protein M409DRAFT_63152 [Zasmidium cellare ATCC 36951]